MPKIRDKNPSTKEVEAYANQCQDSFSKVKKKKSRISINLLEEELHQLKILAEKDKATLFL